MKKINLLLIAITIITHISCERDDICPASTATTPNLIIDVFDFESPDDQKDVPALYVIGIDNNEVLSGYEGISTNDIILPLRTDENTTQYSLTKDAVFDDDGLLIDGNEDIITINYSRTEVFVSRACGFKTIYENVTLTCEQDDDPWILSTIPLNSNQSVEDETTTHFNIFH